MEPAYKYKYSDNKTENIPYPKKMVYSHNRQLYIAENSVEQDYEIPIVRIDLQDRFGNKLYGIIKYADSENITIGVIEKTENLKNSGDESEMDTHNNEYKKADKAFQVVRFSFFAIFIAFATLSFVNTGKLSLITKIYISATSLLSLIFIQKDYKNWRSKHC